jgi:hypothetical protein
MPKKAGGNTETVKNMEYGMKKQIHMPNVCSKVQVSTPRPDVRCLGKRLPHVGRSKATPAFSVPIVDSAVRKLSMSKNMADG